MRHLSLGAVFLIATIFAAIRLSYMDWQSPVVASVLTWDAFGYYLYLPGQYIYHDLSTLDWLPQILEKYHPTGELYQTIPLPNGNYAMKYLMGLSILYTPFFFLGHYAAGWLGYPQDGFSAPYALAACFGAWVYAFAGLLLLSKVLLRYFSDRTTALTLLLVALATNYPQYVSVDSAMTHGFLFGVYALLLYVIIRWHEKPSKRLALFIGLIIGIGAITRPTEGVMLFLALLWQMPAAKGNLSKWAFFRQNPAHLGWAVAGGFLGILPQLIYWKNVTGNWIFDVGAKFLFFRPHWQVLFGWEKGWFIYTPVAVFMVAGMFFMRNYPFRKAVLIFVLLNTWIVIAWSDWHYGATYSSRALVQSYPVLALPLAIVVKKMLESRWLKYLGLPLSGFLIFVNLFQIWQYNRTILHYRDMNRKYYQAIFLNPRPTPVDMSLLDTDEIIRDESAYLVKNTFQPDSTYYINKAKVQKAVFLETPSRQMPGYDADKEQWLYIEATVKSEWGAFETNLVAQLTQGDRTKRRACRMHNGICDAKGLNAIAFYFRLPPDFENGYLSVFAETNAVQNIEIEDVTLRLFERQ